MDFDKDSGNRVIAKEDITKGELLMISKAFYLLTMEEYLKGLKEHYESVKYKRYKKYYFDKIMEFVIEPEFYLYEDILAQKNLSEKDFEKILDLDDDYNWNVKYTERAKQYANKKPLELMNIANINSIRIYSSIFFLKSMDMVTVYGIILLL